MLKNLKTVLSEKDLNFGIKITNLTDRWVRAYNTLWYARMPSPFANYDCLLFKKTDTAFVFVDHYSYESPYSFIMDSLRVLYEDDKADSIIRVFDISKDSLGPGSTRFLQFNLATNNFYLDSGEYKLQIAFRVRNQYKDNKSGIEKIDYIYSDWFYFKIEMQLFAHEPM
jgi:hypothetical protein